MPGRFEVELHHPDVVLAVLHGPTRDFVAHGIGNVQDLPIPAWLFYRGAVGAASRRSSCSASSGRGRSSRLTSGAAPSPGAFSRHRARPAAGRAPGRSRVALFGLVWASALFGTTDPNDNLAPTWVYIVFWLGHARAVGRVRQRLACALAVACDRRRVRLGVGARWAGGQAAGRVSRAARPLARRRVAVRVRALELAYSDPASPRALAFAITLYTYVTLFGMASFGREPVGRSVRRSLCCSGSSVAIAPLHAVDGRIHLRWPLTGLAGAEPTPGSVAFVAVMLGSVLFDGYSRTARWQDLAARVEGPHLVTTPASASSS